MEILKKQNHDFKHKLQVASNAGKSRLLENEWAIPPGQADSLIVIELPVTLTLRDHAYWHTQPILLLRK